MKTIGYARVSTAEQSPQLQIDALEKSGCDRIFTDVGVSGMKASRPELDRALDYMRAGDVLVIWKLDRLGRSTLNLLTLVQDLEKRGIELVSLTDSIDTKTPMGRMFFTIFASLAQLERDQIAERTSAGLEAARAMGRVGGRPNALGKKEHRMVFTLFEGGTPIADIADQFGVSVSTVKRSLRSTRDAQAHR